MSDDNILTTHVAEALEPIARQLSERLHGTDLSNRTSTAIAEAMVDALTAGIVNGAAAIASLVHEQHGFLPAYQFRFDSTELWDWKNDEPIDDN